MKKQLALLISICMIAVSINPMLVTADSKINTGEEFVELSTEPYENEYGLMANAIELAQMFSLAYEFDKENKAFIIYDDLHGEIMLMHNATKFYSGDRVYPCQPYFYVENDVPMIEIGFFCDMFMSSYEYDKDTGKIIVNVGEIREDRAKLIKDGNVMPLYISPFYDTCGLMVSAEDIAKAFGITYEFDGNNAVFDGIYEFEDRAQYFFADGEKIEYYPCFKVEDEMGFIEVGFFADLFGYGYTYDEETHTVEIAEKFNLMGEESPAISGTIQYNGSLEKSTTVEILIQQTALNKESVPTYGGTTGEVIKLGEVTLTPSKPQAQYNFDIYDYATDEYATYMLFYKSETESGYYSRNGGIVPIDVEVETNAEFYPLAEHFSFTSSSSADLKIGKSGIVEGKICIEDGSSVIDESLDVNLILRTRTATRHNYYGNVTYTTGKTYELGTTHFDKGDTTREYSYDTLQYYNADYPSYMIFYELNGLSENIAPAGYYNTDYGFTTLSKIPSKTVYGTSREFNLREYVVADMPLTITSGTTGNIEWSFNRSTGLLTIKGSGEITNEMPWTPYKQEIKSLVIDGTFNIGTDAFAYCSNIKDVEITGPRITFEENAFCYCTSLERAKLDCEITGNGTFNNCTALKEVIVSPTLKVIGERAFLKCSALENITIPSGVTSIGNIAFYDCSSLKEIKIPDSVESLGEDAFGECEDLATVELGDGITTIDVAVFQDCISLKEIIIPDSVNWICDAAFAGCTSLESIVLPDGIKVLGINIFKNCSNLKTINIPESITKIPYGAFSGCKSLTDITLPEKLTLIDSYAFRNCSGIESITIPNRVEKIAQEAFSGTSITECDIPDSVIEMGSGVFYNCQKLKTVKLNDKITSIPSMTFEDCYALEEITIPKNIKSIRDLAFARCYNLKYITFEGSAPYLEDEYVFLGVSGVTAYYPALNETYESLKEEYSHFSWLEKIVYTIIFDVNGGAGSVTSQTKDNGRSVTLTDKVPKRAYYTFLGWSTNKFATEAQYQPGDVIEENADMTLYAVWSANPLSGVIENGDEKIEWEINPEITTLSIKGSGTVTNDMPWTKNKDLIEYVDVAEGSNIEIGDEAFKDYANLLLFDDFGNCKTIGKSAFSGCSKLNGAIISESVETICANAFENCSAMSNISIPASVKRIEDNVFNGCDSLREIRFRGEAPDMVLETFDGVSSDTVIYYMAQYHYTSYTGMINKYEELTWVALGEMPDKPEENVIISEASDNDNRIIDISIAEPYKNAVVWIAVYDENGSLISVCKDECKNSVQFILEKNSEQYKCSVMIWDVEMKPFCENKTLILDNEDE